MNKNQIKELDEKYKNEIEKIKNEYLDKKNNYCNKMINDILNDYDFNNCKKFISSKDSCKFSKYWAAAHQYPILYKENIVYGFIDKGKYIIENIFYTGLCESARKGLILCFEIQKKVDDFKKEYFILEIFLSKKEIWLYHEYKEK